MYNKECRDFVKNGRFGLIICEKRRKFSQIAHDL